MTMVWFVTGICLIVALAGAAGLAWFGKRHTEENAQDMATDEEMSYSLRPRVLTAKEMHDATLKGSFEKIRIPVR